MKKLLQTQEIGSLAKPRWRTKGYRGKALSKDEIAEAVYWGRKLGIENLEEFVKLLIGHSSSERNKAILEWAVKYAVRFFEAAGLDIVSSGEQWRSEMYEHVIRRAAGFEFLGFVKSFDYRYFNKAACVDKPKYLKPFYLEEFVFTRESTNKKIKVPFTGPYTLVDWTFNEYYEREVAINIRDLKKRKFRARQDFVFDLTKEVLRPEIRKLVNSGARWIQIDEPAATTAPTDEEMMLFVESFNEMVRGFNCRFSLHNCYSNYEVLAKYAFKLRNCSQLALEYANRDSRREGSKVKRTGYQDIRLFDEHGYAGDYGLGVVDVHTDFVETPELIRDRILHAAGLVGDPRRICVSTDCGLRTRTWRIAFEKLRNMVQGAGLARRALK